MLYIYILSFIFGGFAISSTLTTISETLPLVALYLPGPLVIAMIFFSLHKSGNTNYRLSWKDPLVVLAIATNLIGSSAAIHYIGGA